MFKGWSRLGLFLALATQISGCAGAALLAGGAAGAGAESSSKITIRIGMFGDRSRSRRLLEAIRRHL
jgi:hypothetical protein